MKRNKIKLSPRFFLFAFCCLCFICGSVHAQKTKTNSSQKTSTTTATPKPPVKTIVVQPQTGTVTAAPKTPVAEQPKEVVLSPFEAEVLVEINLARSNPAEYAKYLEDWKKNYKGNELRLPNRTSIVTIDGKGGVDEAIEFLKKAQPVGKLSGAAGLVSAAQAQLKDMQKSGRRGHRGSDGSLPDQRIERYGRWEGGMSELIDYTSQSAREIVINIILDDGVAARPHRADLFSNKFKLIGVAAGDSQQLGKLCILVMTGGFTDKKSF